MNIDNLTFGELKQIAALFNNGAQTAPDNSMVGQFCVARCYSAGVHAGEVVSVNGECVTLKNSRRLWSWSAKDGVALSGVAQVGLNADKSKVDVMNPTIYLTGVCELIPCSAKAKESINEA
jgi:hypothetical protein